jgi:hypothetical protein
MKIRKIGCTEARNVTSNKMPKEMSKWIENNIENLDYIDVYDLVKKGYAMKSETGTVIFFPNWNCDSQFRRIVNKLR